MENIILGEKSSMKTPITISISVEAKQLYEKLKADGYMLSDEADKMIKEEAKKRGIKIKKS